LTVLTEQLSPVLDRLSLEIELFQRTGTLATQLGRLFINGWLIARVLRQDIQALRDEIATLIADAGSAELDPDDRLTDILLTLQQTIQRAIRLRDKQLRSPLSLYAHWMIRWSRQLLMASHADLGWIREAIMEHDADVSPVMGEVFTSADKLIAALHRDIAV